jgi:hypothetical protein
MGKFVITEEEKKTILGLYNLNEQSIDIGIEDISSMSNRYSEKAKEKSPFIRTPDDYVRFMTWTTELQPTIEKMFGVSCKSSKDIETSTAPGEFGFAGKCQLIWRLITKLLNIYLVSDYSPIKNDTDRKKYYSVLDLIKSNNELTQIANQVFRGQNTKGEKYNENVTGGVYITPNSLENAVTRIYTSQRNLLR